MKTVLITGCCFLGMALRPRAAVPRAGLERNRHYENAARRHSALVGATTHPASRRDEARQYRCRDRGVWARMLVNNAGHWGRCLRSHTDGNSTRSVRDQHLRRDGDDDAGGSASASRAEVGRGSECVTSSVTLADATNGCVYREQGGHRRVHRITRARARCVQRTGQTG